MKLTRFILFWSYNRLSVLQRILAKCFGWKFTKSFLITTRKPTKFCEAVSTSNFRYMGWVVFCPFEIDVGSAQPSMRQKLKWAFTSNSLEGHLKCSSAHIDISTKLGNRYRLGLKYVGICKSPLNHLPWAWIRELSHFSWFQQRSDSREQLTFKLSLIHVFRPGNSTNQKLTKALWPPLYLQRIRFKKRRLILIKNILDIESWPNYYLP